MVERLIDESVYPVILCGDFNETPYGNAYGNIRDRLKNAFEERGNGFGFTLNRSPRIVRIDNQFCSESIKVLDFQTFSDIMYSDHLPILGRYQVGVKKLEKL
jgi:endonuclease/exonuclease/phosphatase (EEP) superfamily protein YafD